MAACTTLAWAIGIRGRPGIGRDGNVSGQQRAGSKERVSLAAKVRFLERPESYPEPTQSVRVIETHMSWVFVGDRFVYKMKKPVRTSFLDFSTLALRRHYCEESLRLNRRLAASVYLGVVPLTADPRGRLELNGSGEPVEWLEKMRRLPDERMLDRAIARGTATGADVRRVADVLARFYRDAAPVPMTSITYRQRLERAVDDTRAVLGDPELGLDRHRLDRAVAAQRAFLSDSRALLDARLAAGKIIEAHGDLRPEHVALLDEPVIIDCLEFNRDFRLMDAADELAYLAMECTVAGAPFVEPLLFDTYAAVTGDRVPPGLIGFYQSHRALIRAKLAIWHLPDYPAGTHPKWLRQAAEYLATAERCLSA